MRQQFRVICNRMTTVAVAGAMFVGTVGAENLSPATKAVLGSAPVTIVSPVPLPVTGSMAVSGAVSATQSGTWNVGITGALPPISAQSTVKVGEFVVPAQTFIDQGIFFDASPYKQIRTVATSTNVQGDCTGPAFTVFLWLVDESGAAIVKLDQYAVSGSNGSPETSKIYDVVAERLAFTAKTNCAVRLIVYGRTN